MGLVSTLTLMIMIMIRKKLIELNREALVSHRKNI